VTVAGNCSDAVANLLANSISEQLQAAAGSAYLADLVDVTPGDCSEVGYNYVTTF
jgi:hypothetical protein